MVITGSDGRRGGIFVYVVIREQQESYNGYVANESSMITIPHHLSPYSKLAAGQSMY